MQAPERHPSRATGPRQLALKVSLTYLVVAGALGTVLMLTSRDRSAAAPPPEVAQPIRPEAAWPTTSDEPAPSFTTRTITSTAPVSNTPFAEYRQVQAKSGMTTVVPSGWAVVDCTSGNGCEQSNDPYDSERFLRFGGSPSPAEPLSRTQGEYEQQFAKRAGYQRIRLTDGTYHGYPSVEWEFELLVNGVRKHIRAQYWRADGDDNFVYASSTTDTWSQTLPVYQAMIADSKP